MNWPQANLFTPHGIEWAEKIDNFWFEWTINHCWSSSSLEWLAPSCADWRNMVKENNLFIENGADWNLQNNKIVRWKCMENSWLELRTQSIHGDQGRAVSVSAIKPGDWMATVSFFLLNANQMNNELAMSMSHVNSQPWSPNSVRRHSPQKQRRTTIWIEIRNGSASQHEK